MVSVDCFMDSLLWIYELFYGVYGLFYGQCVGYFMDSV